MINLNGLSYPLHHIAIAVKDLDNAIKIYTNNLKYTLLARETVTEFDAEVVLLLPHGTKEHSWGITTIELITPLSSTGSLQKFIDKRGEGLHHICFAVKDIKAEQKKLEQAGYSFTSPTPNPGAHHGLVNFIHPKGTNGVLIELRQEVLANL
jgi:methylmalonyl-CoA/ethylmalonyl-CoA epimerase